MVISLMVLSARKSIIVSHQMAKLLALSAKITSMFLEKNQINVESFFQVVLSWEILIQMIFLPIPVRNVSKDSIFLIKFVRECQITVKLWTQQHLILLITLARLANLNLENSIISVSQIYNTA